MRTQRDIIYICCLWKGNNICEGNWREKRVNELWGNWLSMRQPQFKGTQIVLTAILPKTKRPTMGSGHEQASLVKQWGSKYITDYIKRISAENNEAERIRWESHKHNRPACKFYMAKGQTYNAARSHLLWIAAIGCRWGMVTPLCQANALQNGLWCNFFIHRSWPIKSLALDCGHGHSDEGRGLGPTCLGNVSVFW